MNNDIERRLESVGGFDEMAELCSDALSEIRRLKVKCDMQAKILQSLRPEHYPGIYFIHADLGEKDENGMPEKLYVVPAYGVDFSYEYVRTNKTVGPEW